MRKFVLAIGLFAITASVAAQTEMADMVHNKKENKDGHSKGAWTKGGLFSLSVAQGGSQNWAAGAEQFSLSLNTFANLFANKKWGKNTWENNLDMNYAFMNTTSLGVRKNDDRIDFVSRYTHQLKGAWNFATLYNFRSQFTNGYTYGADGSKHRTSGFFAPAYMTLAPGFEWKPCEKFNLFFSPIALRTVIVTNKPYSYLYQGGIKPDGSSETPLATTYGVDPGREINVQYGGFVSANYNNEIFKNVFWRSRLDLFSNYNSDNALNLKTYFTNAFILKVNKWLNVTYNIDVIYDDEIRQFGPNHNAPRTQSRSLLGVGIATKL